MNHTEIHKTPTSLPIYGLCLLIFVFIGRTQELFPYFTRFQPGKIAIGLTIILYIFAPKTERSFNPFLHAEIKYIIAIWILAILSIPFSVWPGQSFNFAFESYLKYVIFIFLFVKIAQTPSDLRKSLWSLAIAICLLSVAVWQTKAWGRVSVTAAYDPNDLSFVMVVAMPIIYYLMKTVKGPLKLFLIFTLLMAVLSFIKTSSRGGIIGLTAITILTALKEGRENKLKAVIPTVIISLIFCMFLWYPVFRDRVTSIFSIHEDYTMTETFGRWAVWQRCTTLVLRNPLLGSGAGTCVVAQGQSFTGIRGAWYTAHNSFLQIGVELGVTGMFLFAGLILTLLKNIRHFRITVARHSEYRELFLLSCGLEISLYGYIIAGFFLSQAYSYVLYFLVACTVIMKSIQNDIFLNSS